MQYARKIIGAMLLVLAAGGQPQAQTPSAGATTVGHPWARATPAGAKTGAA
jgi:periplasmic copper chaperone A